MRRQGGRYIVDPKTGEETLVHRTMPAPDPAPATTVETPAVVPPSEARKSQPVSAGTKQKKDD